MEQPLDNLDNPDTKTARVVQRGVKLALFVVAVLVLITGTTPGIAGAQQLQEPQEKQENHEEQEQPHGSSHGGPHSANVQSSWDLVDESGNLHYEIDSAYAESFKAAAASWNELGAVDIESSPSESETDLVVTDGYLGGPMANTRSDGLITFDPGSMDAATDNAQETAAAHELGHALGFGHVEGESVMTTPIITNSSSNYSEPTSYDRQEYRERWGSAPEDDSQSNDQPQSDDGGGGDTTLDDPYSTGEGQSPESGQESQYNDQTVEQPDSAKEGDGGADSPEKGWTPEECFPFCEEGPPSGDSGEGDQGGSDETGGDSEDEGSGTSDPGPTTPGAGDGEDGSSQGYTHTGSNEGDSTGSSTNNSTNSSTNRSTNDQAMTNEQACETIRDVQKESSGDEDGSTMVLEQRIECDRSSSDSSSGSSSGGDEADTADTGADKTADQQTTQANKSAQEQVENANKEAQEQIEQANKEAEEQMEKAEQSIEEQIFSGSEMSGELFGDDGGKESEGEEESE